MIYLVDKSAWEQLRYSAAARERFAHLAATGELAVTSVVAAELLYSARNYEQLAAHRRELELLTWLESGDDIHERMLAVQQSLSRTNGSPR